MKKWTILASCLLVVGIMISVLPIGSEAHIYDAVVRLHVLANSDSEADQALKLKVRDAVLEAMSGRFDGVEDFEAAYQRITENIPAIEEAAAAVIAAEGYAYPITVTLTQENYPSRTYAHVSLPAGVYHSLRVQIGEAEGQNWWCVLFPPLCLSSAIAKPEEDVCIEAGLSVDQYQMISNDRGPRYQIKFKFLEFFSDLFH